MNRTILSLIWTVIIFCVINGLFLWISIDIKAREDEYILVGFEVLGREEVKRIKKRAGGTEEVYSPFGDVDVDIKKSKKKLALIDKPPYKGKDISNAEGKTEGYKLTGELSKRKLIHFEKPLYPEGKNENATVKLRITASPDGVVKRIEVINTAGLDFDRSAIQAVRNWRFQPLQPNLEQLEQKGIVTIYFRIK